MKKISVLITALFFGLLSVGVHAHAGGAAADGLMSGFLHPLLGFDHLVAMIAVGIWGAFLGPRAIWMLPIAFPLVMVLGGILGMAGVPLPAVETGIAASALVIGALIALAVRPPLWLALLIVAVFAVFHGHAHGTELPAATDALGYSIGFVLATGLLHLCGIAFALVDRLPHGKLAIRLAGSAIGLAGLGFLSGTL
jgi:urease accessory protein